MSEEKTRLEKKKEELASLEFDYDIQDLEGKIKRRENGGGVNNDPPKDTLGEKIVDKIMVPMIERTLNPDKGNSVTQDAIKLANKALDKAGRGTPPPSGNTVSDIVGALVQFKGLLTDDASKAQLDKLTEQVQKLGEGPRKEGDLDTIDRVWGIVDKIQERMKATDPDSSDKYYNFERWRVDQERKNTMQDRAFQLRIRQQDKEYDLKLAQLSIQKERNEMGDRIIKTIGKAIGEELIEDDGSEETASVKGRPQLIKMPCSECKAEILIPPEAQVVGKEIKCSKCESIFTWEEE